MMQDLHDPQPQTRESQRNRAPKLEKTTKEHNRNQSKKQHIENNDTSCVLKNVTSVGKTQGKL